MDRKKRRAVSPLYIMSNDIKGKRKEWESSWGVTTGKTEALRF